MFGVNFDEFEIRHRRMLEVIQTARTVAPSPAHLLIIGAAGTGKTALARWTHQVGRAHRAFVSISARDVRDRVPDVSTLFREARDGTLLIEDIEHSSMAFQAALALQLESLTDLDARTRLICTSRRELRSLARQELFRQDLYYRITVMTLEIPSLEERVEDFASLCGFLVDVSAILHGKKGLQLTVEAEQKLQSWNWPGNIRELENVIERAVTLAQNGVITADAIRFEMPEAKTTAEFGAGMSLSEVERRLIMQTLELTAQNRTRAAQILGISIRTLRNKLHEYKEAGVL